MVTWCAGREVGMDVVTFIIPSDCPRFQSGDAKGLVKASTRGDDLYIFVDPGNYSVTYQLFGYENHLSPDDHFQNLMRLIQAVAGRAHRISVIMPSLYGGRQHRRVSRESLDCALRCSSCAMSALRTSSPLMLMTPRHERRPHHELRQRHAHLSGAQVPAASRA